MTETSRQRRRATAHPARRVPPPTVEQVDELIRAMPKPEYQGFVAVAAWSGLRLSEIAALEWTDLTWLERNVRLHVRKGKGGRERHSILLAPAVPWLPPVGEQGRVFVNGRGNRFTQDQVHKWWSRWKPPHLAGTWFHDLRKFHATYLLDLGMTDLDVAVQLGHLDSLGRPNPDYVRTTYGFPSTRDALERIANLPLDGGQRS